jgi:flagellar hook assembly protein FlgD
VTSLAPSFPNPFNMSTCIPFTVDDRMQVTLRVYDISGRLVRTLLDRDVGQGSHEREWDGRDDAGVEVASGVYFVRLSVGTRRFTQRAILIR